MSWSILEDKLNIIRAGTLKLKDDHKERTRNVIPLGRERYMSSDNMYCHLSMLENLVSKTVRRILLT